MTSRAKPGLTLHLLHASVCVCVCVCVCAAQTCLSNKESLSNSYETSGRQRSQMSPNPVKIKLTKTWYR